MRNKHPSKGTQCWAPTFNHNVHTWSFKIYGTLASLLVGESISRHPFLEGSPSQLTRLLNTFLYKTINRPSIPKLPGRSDLICYLGISLSNMNAFDAQIHHQLTPIFPRLQRWFNFETCIFSNIQKSLLDKPADHTGVGSTTRNSCRFCI